MFGSGPGALPSDARTLKIDPMTQRDRQDEALGVIIRLLRGDDVGRDDVDIELTNDDDDADDDDDNDDEEAPGTSAGIVKADVGDRAAWRVGRDLRSVA